MILLLHKTQGTFNLFVDNKKGHYTPVFTKQFQSLDFRLIISQFNKDMIEDKDKSDEVYSSFFIMPIKDEDYENILKPLTELNPSLFKIEQDKDKTTFKYYFRDKLLYIHNYKTNHLSVSSLISDRFSKVINYKLDKLPYLGIHLLKLMLINYNSYFQKYDEKLKINYFQDLK